MRDALSWPLRKVTTIKGVYALLAENRRSGHARDQSVFSGGRSSTSNPHGPTGKCLTHPVQQWQISDGAFHTLHSRPSRSRDLEIMVPWNSKPVSGRNLTDGIDSWATKALDDEDERIAGGICEKVNLVGDYVGSPAGWQIGSLIGPTGSKKTMRDYKLPKTRDNCKFRSELTVVT
jgi:hypothetical protein